MIEGLENRGSGRVSSRGDVSSMILPGMANRNLTATPLYHSGLYEESQ